jgi:hypothetical protein
MTYHGFRRRNRDEMDVILAKIRDEREVRPTPLRFPGHLCPRGGAPCRREV